MNFFSMDFNISPVHPAISVYGLATSSLLLAKNTAAGQKDGTVVTELIGQRRTTIVYHSDSKARTGWKALFSNPMQQSHLSHHEAIWKQSSKSWKIYFPIIFTSIVHKKRDLYGCSPKSLDEWLHMYRTSQFMKFHTSF